MSSPRQNKIFLTGYRATGKTTVGELLAEKLSFTFLDMDKAIEEGERKSITEMVAEFGWPYFRDKERALLEKLLGRGNMVVATGGGAILHQDIWPKVMASGLVVWLTLAPDQICRRLLADAKTEGQRPSLSGADICAEVTSVLAEREGLYRRGCHIHIDADQPPQNIVETIEKHFTETGY